MTRCTTTSLELKTIGRVVYDHRHIRKTSDDRAPNITYPTLHQFLYIPCSATQKLIAQMSTNFKSLLVNCSYIYTHSLPDSPTESNTFDVLRTIRLRYHCPNDCQTSYWITEPLHTQQPIGLPFSLFLQWDLRTRLDLQRPAPGDSVADRQGQQVRNHDQHAKARNLTVGQAVMARNFRAGAKWVPGVIVEQKGLLS